MNSPLVLLPTYGDRDTLPGMVRTISAQGLPILIVDDGSDEATRAEIRALSAAHGDVAACFRPHNGGKGAAVHDGMRWAAKHGFSHAIQIDADDQHDTGDLPLFVQAAAEDPQALVLGCPVYDAQVPLERLIARQFSKFWVHVATLSRAITDPLCGFRAYPVASTLQVLDSTQRGWGMDFDPEVAVRLYWRGLRIVNIPTRVRYPRGGHSHFRNVADTSKIFAAQARLVFEMVSHLRALQRRRGGT